MKTQSIILFFFTLTLAATKGQNNIDLNPTVKSVTLYPQWALVTVEVRADIPDGNSTLIFHGLPSHIDKQSIQLASTGSITILSVSAHDDFLTNYKKTGKYKSWQDSLDILNDKLDRLNNGINLLTDSKTLLDKNMTVGGANIGTSVASVKAMYEFYQHQVNHIDDSLLHLDKESKNLEGKINKIKNEITEWRNNTDTVACQVEAVISTEGSKNLGIRLSYIAYNAGWKPVYDLRVTDTKHPSTLAYKAITHQHTGQDWKDIDLTLSTSNPEVNQTAPVLSPWYLSFYLPHPPRAAQPRAAGGAEMARKDMLVAGAATNQETYIEGNGIVTETNESQVSVDFHIDSPYTLPTDNKPHTVEIKRYDLNTTYRIQTIPKLETQAFLMADLTHWDNYDFLSGTINIYYAGDYIGKSNLDSQNATDTLTFSLGRDKKIVVKRERVIDYSSTRWFATTKTQFFSYNILLHNTHSDSVTIEVDDQTPLSTDHDIQIELHDTGGATLSEDGKLTWKVSLAPGESKKLSFSYAVTCPKDKNIQGLR